MRVNDSLQDENPRLFFDDQFYDLSRVMEHAVDADNFTLILKFSGGNKYLLRCGSKLEFNSLVHDFQKGMAKL